MKKIHRVLIGLLAAAMAAPAVTVPASASAPALTVDEVAYVNLDYYGKAEKVNIVKGCSLNGNSSFTDYGSYSQVTNMTNDAKPELTPEGVNWKLPQGTGQFYFECTPKDQTVVLPWSFDVSYKLNGVPADAKKLAGASGMVEIDVKAAPNKNAPAYYRNNMLLQVGTYVKMKDTLSVEAPGAQIQSLGEYKAVLFAGLPGEEKTYTIRIGTKNFETIGMLMMMIPGTFDQLKDIKDLHDDKDTIRDSIDSINTGTNQILESLEAMSEGLSRTQNGLSALDGARASISSNKGKVYKNADNALADLTTMTKQTSALIPHLQKGQQLVQDVNADMNAINSTLSSSSGTLIALSQDLEAVHNDVSSLRDMLKDLSDDNTTDKRKRAVSGLQTDISNVNYQIKQLPTIVSQLNSVLGDKNKNTGLIGSVSNLQNTLNDIRQVSSALPDPTAQAVGAISGATAPVLNNLNTTTATAESISLGLSQLVSSDSDSLTTNANSLIDVLESYLNTIDDHHDDADKLLKNANLVNRDIQSFLDSCQTMIKNVNTLNDTTNRYKDDTVAALKDTATLTQGLTNSLTSSQAFLTSLETLMETSGDKLDDGTKKTLNGLIQMLQQSLNGIGKTSTVKNAGNKIRSTVDREIDKFQSDNNLLNLDYEAKPVSLTSSKNPNPSSIQIVMRTEEIKKESVADNIRDMEKANQAVSPWARICNVFSTLWKAILSLFSK